MLPRDQKHSKGFSLRCFGGGSRGIEAAAGLLAFLGRCPELQVLSLGRCDQIPAAAWQQLEGAQWPKLTKVDFGRCLGFWAPVGVCVVWSRSLLGCDGDVGVDEVAGTQPFHRSGLTNCRCVLSSEP
ncbi:unnamed protein product [Symbiodinium necroappetens]|uniref:Uncharacterized protein n=1 Tax=Symbiodinium necroappetens TaxID=1628268 RepID=A0A813CIS2_9DINO|nr:unnamed protein product [Symbiodinium necroappetens]